MLAVVTSVERSDYLFKPFEPELLRAKVAVFVELHRQREALRRQAEQLQAERVARALSGSHDSRKRGHPLDRFARHRQSHHGRRDLRNFASKARDKMGDEKVES